MRAQQPAARPLDLVGRGVVHANVILYTRSLRPRDLIA